LPFFLIVASSLEEGKRTPKSTPPWKVCNKRSVRTTGRQVPKSAALKTAATSAENTEKNI
jgi:hypothetical protein